MLIIESVVLAHYPVMWLLLSLEYMVNDVVDDNTNDEYCKLMMLMKMIKVTMSLNANKSRHRQRHY